MRRIETHIVNVCNEHITIDVLDEPGDGGACHHYFMSGFHTKGNPAADSSCDDDTGVHLVFQNGPIPDMGVNGITHEALIAVVIDRLRGFQSGPFACQENHAAIGYLESAANALKCRTMDREARGVEGTHTL